jgi:CheY-like chemotaxis protein
LGIGDWRSQIGRTSRYFSTGRLFRVSTLFLAVAKSGESAIAKIEAIASDLILLDVMMPGIDGFQLLRGDK